MSRAQKGFSLIEVMIAFAVMAIGLLAIASFQTNLFSESGTNKAKAEALAIAQARLDEFRNYSANVGDQTDFNTEFAAVTNQSDGSVTGKNATFSRSYTIAGGDGVVKTITVNVSWSDRSNTSQSVALTTRIGFESPRSAGDVPRNDATPLVASATGRARLGDGVINPNGPGVSLISNNGDGTKTYSDGNDLKLTFGQNDDGTLNVVLTLDEACQSGSNCTDFVKIKGRVYIDTGSQNTLQPGDIFIKASDAAFCHRHYTISGTSHNVTNSTTKTSTPNTSNGEYEYFDYTCYLGGGWHGNIGVLLTGGIAQSDKICMGDPTSANAWEQPVIAARRAYRGMIYKKDGNGNPAVDANNMVIYASIGVEDSLVLPDPNSSDKTHDFVIGKMAASDVEGSKCVSKGVMVRTDATVDGVSGKLFVGMPGDFVCLNPDNVDAYDTSIYGINTYCPYDPTDPPVARKTLTGSISVTAPESLASTVSKATLTTSDGPGNCLISSFSYAGGTHTASYSCDYYLWSANSTWSGSLTLATNSGQIACSSYIKNYSAINTNQTAQNFSCLSASTLYLTGEINVTAASSMAATVQGITLTPSGGGACTIESFEFSGGVHSADYTCEIAYTGPWSGTVTLNTNTTQLACPTAQLSYTDITSNQSGQNFTTCTSGLLGQTVTIAGTVTLDGSKKLSSAVIQDSNGATFGSCTVPAAGSSYSCTSNVINSASWSGRIVFNATSGGKVCYTGYAGSSSVTVIHTGLTGNITRNFLVTNGNCP